MKMSLKEAILKVRDSDRKFNMNKSKNLDFEKEIILKHNCKP